MFLWLVRTWRFWPPRKFLDLCSVYFRWSFSPWNCENLRSLCSLPPRRQKLFPLRKKQPSLSAVGKWQPRICHSQRMISSSPDVIGACLISTPIPSLCKSVGSCRISDSLAQMEGGMVYRHMMPHPPVSRYTTPTNSSYNTYVYVYACRLYYYTQYVGCGVSARVANNKQRIVKLAQKTDSRFTKWTMCYINSRILGYSVNTCYMPLTHF